MALLLLLLPAALTCASCAQQRPDSPGGSGLSQRHSDVIRSLGQCELENAVAREMGGAIRRAKPEQCRAEESALRRASSRPCRSAVVKGKVHPPVSGTVLHRFGEPDKKGAPSEGIVLRTRAGAQVAAPSDSRIVFAQPHKEYGQLLILQTCDGYHFVLAGMTKIYGVEGQTLLEGEPVGVMAGTGGVASPEPGAGGTGDAQDAGAGPELYFEIRRDGKPVDPLPWLAKAGLERTSQ